MTAHPAGPHFVWVHLYDPHDPYEPPAPYSQTYKDRLYDGEIAYADSVLAGFVGYLKKTGRYDNAIIVVVGDHGEGLGEHHEETHGIFLYDSTTHVPLIMKTPGARRIRGRQLTPRCEPRTSCPQSRACWVSLRLRSSTANRCSLTWPAPGMKIAPPSAKPTIPCASAGRPCARCAPGGSSSSKRRGRSYTTCTPIREN